MATATLAERPAGQQLPAPLEDASALARALIAASRSASTRAAYAGHWRCFEAWCRSVGLAPLPAAPSTICLFIAAETAAGRRPATIDARLAAIRCAHALAKQGQPVDAAEVKELRQGVRRTLGTAPRQKRAATAEKAKAMLATIDGASLTGKRDRALLALLFLSACRVSELLALRLEDLAASPRGYVLTIRRSKTDQEGQGQQVAVLDGPGFQVVDLVRAWLAAGGIADGYLFRRLRRGGRVTAEPLTRRAVHDLVKRAAAAAGLHALDFSAHSFRAGLLTSAAEAGADVLKLAEVSRHRSLDTLRGYVRRAGLFDGHAAEGFA